MRQRESANGGRIGLAAAGVVALALAVRLTYQFETRELPLLKELVGDAAGYYAWAQSIASGAWIGDEAFYQAPLYPYVLAVVFALVGDAVWVVRAVQAVWGAAACGLLFWATSRLFGSRCGMAAGVMLALYPPAIFFDGIIQKASLGAALTCALLAWMCVAVQRPRPAWPWWALGVTAGLLALVRENALIWIPLLLAWAWLYPREGRRRWLRSVMVVGGAGLVLIPVGVRNAVVAEQWSVTTFQAGPNFYIGNNADADGRYQPLVRGHETPAFERRDATRLAEAAMGRPLSPGEVSRYWAARAWKDIREDPMRWLWLMGRKVLMVFNAYEISDVESQYVYGAASMVLRPLGSVWHFGVLCPLAAAGLVMTWRKRRRLWIFYGLIVTMALAVAAFYVMARYRFPLVPLLVPFAAVAVVRLWDGLRSRQVRGAASAVVAACVVAVVVNWPLYDEERLNAMAWMNVGSAAARHGDLAAATEYFRLAVEGHPESAEGHYNLAQALAVQGRFAEAVEHYRRAVSLAPDLPGIDYNLAVALERMGRFEEALAHYKRAAARDPSDVEAGRAVERLRGRD